MSGTESGDPLNWPNSFTIPSDGDGPTIKAADVNVALEALADRTAHDHAVVVEYASITALKAIDTADFLTGTVRQVRGFGFFAFDPAGSGTSPNIVVPTTGGGRWKLTAGRLTTAVVRPVPLAVATVSTISADQEFGVFTDAVQPLQYGRGWIMSDVSANRYGVICNLQETLRQFNGLTLSSAKLRLAPATGHGALPANMPAFALFRHLASDGTTVDFISGSTIAAGDASANVAAYEVPHDITLTPNQNNVIDTDLYHYSLHIYDEGGANAIAAPMYLSLTLTFAGVLP